MDFLKRLFLQTQNHLKDLTLSQRLAIGSCAALIVVSLMWMVQWAAEPELVPLLDQPITAQEFAPIEDRLQAMGVPYKLADNVLLVPSDRRTRLLAQLSEVQALPKDISIGFTRLIEESSPWIGTEDLAWRRTVALGNELSKVLREMDGVAEARVFIDRLTRRTVNGAPVTPTASVFVKLKPDYVLDKVRTYAIASLVARAVAGLDITKVGVTDARTGRSTSVPAREDLVADDDLEYRQKQEQYYAEQIQSVLRAVPGLLVAVHAELDHEARNETRHSYTKPIQTRDKTESLTEDSTQPVNGPGVVPNTAKSVAVAYPAERREKTSSEAEYEARLASTLTITTPRRAIRSLTASVAVPRSYLAAIFKQANAGKEPSDTEINTSSQEVLKKIAGLAHKALGEREDSGAVAVEWFHDETAVQIGNVAEASSGSDLVAMARTYGSRAGLGALAVISLFMMLMMVRRVGEGPVLPGEEPPTKSQLIRVIGASKSQSQPEPETLTVGSPPVGEAEAREHLLVGREVDENTLRIQQVVDQVSSMIREDPETSAGILQRWIEAEKQ